MATAGVIPPTLMILQEIVNELLSDVAMRVKEAIAAEAEASSPSKSQPSLVLEPVSFRNI